MNETSPQSVVYGYCEPETGELRYVGKTERYLSVRHAQHRIQALKKVDGKYARNSHFDKWLRKWLVLGVDPAPFVIEQADKESLVELELYFISYFRYLGCRLVNHTVGGEGCDGYKHGPEARAKISAAKKGKPNHWQKGRSLTKESKDKISLTKAGISDEVSVKIISMYQDRFSSNEIAKAVGVSQTAILGCLRRNNVSLRTAGETKRRLSPEDELKVVQAYLEGASTASAGVSFGLKDSRCLLKRHEVKIRNAAQQRWMKRNLMSGTT